MRVVPPQGASIELGTTGTGLTVSLIDYSRRETDDFGVTTVVRRDFSRRLSVRLALPFDQADTVQRRLADLRATPATWIADDRFAWLQPLGYYRDFSLDLAVPPTSFCTLTVEGLAGSTTAPDPGGDPAPDLRKSSLSMLNPIAVTDAVLQSSSVPENDAPAWSSSTSYAKGALVRRGHRVYESLTAANAGSDPATAPDKWLDTRPTNRWAMFDEALGTATTAADSIVVGLAAGAATSLALIDVVGVSVRVQANGYDQTQPNSGGTIVFSNLPGTGTVTVTVAGSGTVKVGTLLIGKMLPLGATESSPTAAIADYSRKETDDFGGVTVVARAWAKRLTARALIRTEMLDVVADRIASVRARPVLWIGDAGTDCLTIYGFFRDFSIEVAEGVSKLSLSVEGLSKAAPIPDNPIQAAQSTADEALGKIANITSDSIISAGDEKRRLAALTDQILAEYPDIMAKAAAAGVGSGSYANGYGLLFEYLGGLQPHYRSLVADTPVVPDVFFGKFNDYYLARQLLLSAIPEAVRLKAKAAQDDATAAATAASNAQASANAALGQIAGITSDSIISAGDEKRKLKAQVDQIAAERDDIVAKAGSAGVASGTYTTAYSDLFSYLGSLSPAYTNLTIDTGVAPQTFYGRFNDYYYARQLLLNAIADAIRLKAKAAQDAADAAGLSAANAQTAANSALSQITGITSDSIISAGDEKRKLKAQVDQIAAERDDIVAKAGSAGVASGTYTTAYSDLFSYLGSLSPAYTNLTIDTGITPATFYGRFNDYYFARQLLLNAIADTIRLKAANAQSTADKKSRSWPPAATAPVGAAEGDEWPDTSTNPPTLKRLTGGVWVIVANTVTTGPQIGIDAGASLGENLLPSATTLERGYAFSNCVRVAGVAGDPALFMVSKNAGATGMSVLTAQLPLPPGGADLFFSFRAKGQQGNSAQIAVYFYDAAYGYISIVAPVRPINSSDYETIALRVARPAGAAFYLMECGVYENGVSTATMKAGSFRLSTIEQGADATLANQISVVISNDSPTVECDYQGNPTGAFPVIAARVLRNGVSIAADAATTYTVTRPSDGAAGADGGTVVLDNTAGSVTKGRVSTGPFATGSNVITFIYRVFVSGQRIEERAITVTKNRAAPPAGGGSGSGGGGSGTGTNPKAASASLDNATTGTAYTAAASAGPVRVTLAAGEKLKAQIVNGTVDATNDGGVRGATVKARYAAAATMAGAVDMGGAETSSLCRSERYYSGGESDPAITGSVSLAREVTGLSAGDYWVELQFATTRADAGVQISGTFDVTVTA